MRKFAVALVVALLAGGGGALWTMWTEIRPSANSPTEITQAEALPAPIVWEKSRAQELFQYLSENGNQANVQVGEKHYYFLLGGGFLQFGEDGGNSLRPLVTANARGVLVSRVDEQTVALFNEARDKLLALRDLPEKGG